MPHYEYLCSDCGSRFERFQSMSEEPLTACPDCGGSVRRLISGGGGFIMKGGGSLDAPSCGKESPCCGRETPCGKSGNCHS